MAPGAGKPVRIGAIDAGNGLLPELRFELRLRLRDQQRPSDNNASSSDISTAGLLLRFWFPRSMDRTLAREAGNLGSTPRGTTS